MSRYSSSTIYNNVCQFSISDLKKWGYLIWGRTKSGSISWSYGERESSGVSIEVCFNYGAYIELSYSFAEQDRKYRVLMTSVPSNLNKGDVWYFLCPFTHKRCRILYFINGYFAHREAFSGCLYESQSESGRTRAIGKTTRKVCGADKLEKELSKKYFKTHYAGRMTKRYFRIIKALRERGDISIEEFKRLWYK